MSLIRCINLYAYIKLQVRVRAYLKTQKYVLYQLLMNYAKLSETALLLIIIIIKPETRHLYALQARLSSSIPERGAELA